MTTWFSEWVLLVLWPRFACVRIAYPPGPAYDPNPQTQSARAGKLMDIDERRYHMIDALYHGIIGKNSLTGLTAAILQH